MLMGGQTAEETVFGDITTGASNDLQKASSIARKMVTDYGMSGQLGPRSFDSGQEMVFLGKELSQGHNYSDAVAEKIDAEIREILGKAQQAARGILESQRAKLTLLAKSLLVEESIEGSRLQQILSDSPESAPVATEILSLSRRTDGDKGISHKSLRRRRSRSFSAESMRA